MKVENQGPFVMDLRLVEADGAHTDGASRVNESEVTGPQKKQIKEIDFLGGRKPVLGVLLEQANSQRRLFYHGRARGDY